MKTLSPVLTLDCSIDSFLVSVSRSTTFRSDLIYYDSIRDTFLTKFESDSLNIGLSVFLLFLYKVSEHTISDIVQVSWRTTSLTSISCN